MFQQNYFCIFNADGSFNPKELGGMYDLIQNNHFDFVLQVDMKLIVVVKTILSLLILENYFFTKLGKILFNLNITDILYTYVLGSTKIFKNLNIQNKDFKFCVEFQLKHT